MRKIISITIFVIVALFCSTTAFADVNTRAVGSAKRSCILSLSGSSATCTSTYTDTSGVTAKVVITQTLEKHSFLWIWNTVGGAWTKTSYNGNVSFTNKASNLESGTYRVKTVFDVTSSDGATESITLYSTEKTVG